MTFLTHKPGKSRTAGRMLWLTAACVCGWGLAVSLAEGQGARPRFPLTSAQIVNAMQDRQLPTRGVTVRLAAPITAAIPNPPLEIQGIMLLSPHEMRLRLACRDRSECLSFFAMATYPEEVKAATLMMKPENEAGSAPPVPAAKPVVKLVAAAPAARSAAAVPEGSPAANLGAKATNSSAPPIVRGGSPATLDFDGDRVHVRIEVVCLESGAAGDKIRVTTRDHKQRYVAEIITPVLLKGTF